MAKTIACIIARTVSTRLPLKIMRLVDHEHMMIEFIINRIKKVKKVDAIYICTSTEPTDDILEDIAIKNNINIYRGSADNVISRMLQVGDIEDADILIRITGDNIFTSFEYIDTQIEALKTHSLDYVRLMNVPIGSTAEVMSIHALRDCNRKIDPSVSEYLMLFMFEPQIYKCGILSPFTTDYSNTSLTVDTPRDLRRTKEIISLYNNDIKTDILLTEILDIVNSKNVSDFYLSNASSAVIKYPYGKVITYEEYSKDMERRKEQSFIIKK